MNGDIYLVLESQHVKPGKGGAFARVKLKNVRTNAVLDKTFRSADKIDNVDLEEKPIEFLYQSGDSFHFMDHSTYEETVISESLLGDTARFLLENLEVTAICHNDRVLKIELPTFITAKITSTERGVKGDSTKAGTKPAQIETGTTIQVPLFVNIDDWVKLDTRNGQYVERVQK